MEAAAIPITQKLLVSAGGWPAMKLAQQMQQAGRVVEAAYAPPILSGLVREGNRNLRAGLRVTSASDVENICTCRESREWGRICAHALAVGVDYLARAAPRPAAPATLPPATAPAKTGATFVENGSRAMASIQLHLILPPVFESAWAKQQIMVVTEVELGGKRTMPSALDPTGSYACDAWDLAALEALPELTAMRILPREDFLQLLRSLCGHPRVTFGKATRVQISADTCRPRARVRRATEDTLTIELVKTGNERLLVGGSAAWVLHGHEFQPLREGLPNELAALTNEPIELRGARAQLFAAFEAPRLREWFDLEMDGSSVLPEVETAVPGFLLNIEGSLREVRADLRAKYPDGARRITAKHLLPEQTLIRDAAQPRKILVRDVDAERAALQRLERAGFTWRGDTLVLANENAVARFFGFEFPRLRNEWTATVSPQATKAIGDLEPLAPKIEVIGSGENWFELRYSLAALGGESFSAAELQRLLRSGQTKTRLRNGRTAVFDPAAIADFEEVLRDCDPTQTQPGTYRIARAHADYVATTIEEVGATGVDVRSALAAFVRDKRSVPPLGPLDTRLRDYQREGVSWLWRLAQSNLGGILADEMGLGKTVQTLAFLLANRAAQPALIVCPSSLVTNWRNEASRFTPELRVLVMEGAERHARFEEIAGANLVLTSYALLQRDSDRYKAIAFSTVVLDEAQHIKNPDTQNAQAAFGLRARHRFVLTGTPIENSVRDLWSLMNFALPGYLGSRADFRERYEQPLSRGAAPEVQRRLARRMRPFLLRRKKTEVAKELPEKLEQQLICELSPRQRAAYDGLLREIQAGLKSAHGDAGAARMKMLVGLLRLRQVCCDLRLLGEEQSKEQARDSAKLQLLEELLAEAIDGGHRVLVFSQFVSMLALIRERLETESIRFSYLDGATKERQAVVDEFQRDGAIPVFLMSLKAGGVGLNLSAADTVIHFDPWWNYAAEAQATDRAHRIGQTRVVTAYKLIARDTVEEKIVRLQARKRSASEGVLGSEEPLMRGLTTEDLEELLT